MGAADPRGPEAVSNMKPGHVEEGGAQTEANTQRQPEPRPLFSQLHINKSGQLLLLLHRSCGRYVAQQTGGRLMWTQSPRATLSEPESLFPWSPSPAGPGPDPQTSRGTVTGLKRLKLNILLASALQI